MPRLHNISQLISRDGHKIELSHLVHPTSSLKQNLLKKEKNFGQFCFHFGHFAFVFVNNNAKCGGGGGGGRAEDFSGQFTKSVYIDR